MNRSRALTKSKRPQTSWEFDGHVNELRDALGRVDALATSLKQSFDQRYAGEPDHDVVDRRTSYLIDLLAEAGAQALIELNAAGHALGRGDDDDGGSHA